MGQDPARHAKDATHMHLVRIKHVCQGACRTTEDAVLVLLAIQDQDAFVVFQLAALGKQPACPRMLDQDVYATQGAMVMAMTVAIAAVVTINQQRQELPAYQKARLTFFVHVSKDTMAMEYTVTVTSVLCAAKTHRPY